MRRASKPRGDRHEEEGGRHFLRQRKLTDLRRLERDAQRSERIRTRDFGRAY